jgi:hypothetical protein
LDLDCFKDEMLDQRKHNGGYRGRRQQPCVNRLLQLMNRAYTAVYLNMTNIFPEILLFVLASQLR